MSMELVWALVFFVVLSLLLYSRRKSIVLQKIFFPFLYMILYRSEYGLSLMDQAGKKLKLPLRIFGFLGVIIGFVAMAFISFTMVKTVFDLMFVPKSVAGVAVVVPFQVNVPGFLSVPTFYWLISIFILAIVHEFAHGAMARVHNVHVKSTGFAFFSILIPIIPAAFVEPDEKILKKKTLLQQLSIFAAGAFANIVLAAILFVLLSFLILPAVSSNVMSFSGVTVQGFANSSPANLSGVPLYGTITKIDATQILTTDNFTSYLSKKRPGDKITVYLNETPYHVTLGESPANMSKAYIGIYVSQKSDVNPAFKERYGEFTSNSILWMTGLLMWLFILNLGIGLFNLLPMGPIDGGRMMYAILTSSMEEAKAGKFFYWISMFFFVLILSSLVLTFMK